MLIIKVDINHIKREVIAIYQGQRMDQPPEVICSKDLNYLEDAMTWELMAMKKCNHFAQEADNERIKQALNRAGSIHHKHYQMLLNHVDPGKTL